MMYLVDTAPPSDRTWGLARDTRESIIDPGPWPDLDEAVLYYYLLDFEENQPSTPFRRPGEPNTIWWFGFPRDGLPERPPDIPAAYGRTPRTGKSPTKRDRDRTPPVVNEPRRYGKPLPRSGDERPSPAREREAGRTLAAEREAGRTLGGKRKAPGPKPRGFAVADQRR